MDIELNRTDSERFEGEVIRALSSSAGCDRIAVAALDRCNSTMECAREILAAPEKYSVLNTGIVGGHRIELAAVAVSRTQQSGRGRAGRSWDSSRSGVYLTVGVRLREGATNLYGLSPAIGVSVCETLRTFGVSCGVKWPNDIWATEASGEPRGKIAGVLIEGKGANELLVGVGVNLSGSFDSSGFKATSIAECVPNVPDRLTVAAHLSLGVLSALNQFCEGGFTAFRGRFLAYSLLSGRAIRASEGEREYRGIVTGVTERGELIINVQGESLPLAVSEVHVEEWC